MGINESVAYDVVKQKSRAINMLDKWERREAMLQNLGVYYSDSERFSESCYKHKALPEIPGRSYRKITGLKND